MGKRTIRVNESAFETAKERKEENGQTWDEYLTDTNRTGPDADDVATELTARVDVDASEAKEKIEELRELVKDATDQAERERSRFDSNVSVTLEASERKAIAREVATELKQ